jgi:hypothetical protein
VRLRGHTLRDEGAAFEADPTVISRVRRVTWNTTGGHGFGLCSCGAKSPVLGTGQARKDWHRDHKRSLVTKWFRP